MVQHASSIRPCSRYQSVHPFPDVARHVEQAVAVGRETSRPARCRRSRPARVFSFGNSPCQVLAIHLPSGLSSSPHAILRALETAAGRELPLGLGRQLACRPTRRSASASSYATWTTGCVVLAAERAAGSLRVPPVRAGDPAPPLVMVLQAHRPARPDEHGDPGTNSDGSASGYSAGSGARSASVTWPVARTKSRKRSFVTCDAIDPEAVDLDLVRRGFLRVVVVRPHHERAAGDPRHLGMGRVRGRCAHATLVLEPLGHRGESTAAASP